MQEKTSSDKAVQISNVLCSVIKDVWTSERSSLLSGEKHSFWNKNLRLIYTNKPFFFKLEIHNVSHIYSENNAHNLG